MFFVDFDKDEILRNSVDLGDYYEFTIGSKVEITTFKSLHKNDVMAKNLADSCKDDSLMIKYSPTNKIYFSKNFVSSDIIEKYASFYVDSKNGRLYIGCIEEFGASSGLLTFSGYISGNNLVEKDKLILCSNKIKSSIMSRIKVLSLGVRGNKLLGLYYIPSIKGIKLSSWGSLNTGISPVTYKEGDCNNYSSFTIKDWFDGLTKIKEVD